MVSQRSTSSHLYFWGGVFSNFYVARKGEVLFSAPLWRNGPALPFFHSEGYFMACKALMFGATMGYVDQSTGKWVPSVLERILVEPDPKKAKALGREIQNFDKARWDGASRNFMLRAVLYKFLGAPALAQALVASHDLILVEGSPFDDIWGVKLAWDDPLIEDRANWRGTNWLGDVLMAVRQIIMSFDRDEIERLDVFMLDYRDFPQSA